MILRLLLALLLASAALTASAANHYIRTGGGGRTAGTGNCVDWTRTNACPNLPATLVRGDTYYVAAGNYDGYDFNIANRGTKRITIRKAMVADHGTTAGWLDAYASGEAFFSNSGGVFVCHENTGYITIDGVYGTKGTSGSFGIRLQSTSSRNSATAIWDTYTGGAFKQMGNCDGWVLNYVDIDWNNGTAPGNSGATRCIWLYGALTDDNFTFSNSWCHHSSGFGIYAATSGSGLTVINSRFSDNGGAGSSAHHETLWINPASNVVIDSNEFIDSLPGGLTGWVMIGNSTNVRVSNNVFYCTNPAICYTGGNGVIGTWSSTPNNDGIYVYNNTFVNLATGNRFIFFDSGRNINCRNNLVYTAEFEWTGCGSAGGTNSDNACGGGAGCSGTNQQTGITTAIFRDYANKDLHLTGHTDAGANFSATFTKDHDGAPRTFWDRGAYEFGHH